MSRTIFGISTGFLGEAVLSLRHRLGYSQERLARELGCSTGAVRRWESGLRRPSLAAVARLASIAPDEETRAALGLESGIWNLESPPQPARRRALKSEISNLQSPPLPKTPEDEDRLLQFSDAVEGLNQVYHAAQAGHAAADELLRDLADKLTTRGGDWQTMRYALTRTRPAKSKK